MVQPSGSGIARARISGPSPSGQQRGSGGHLCVLLAAVGHGTTNQRSSVVKHPENGTSSDRDDVQSMSCGPANTRARTV